MRSAFEDALVSGYEALIPAMTNHPKDQHVLAIAVRANAHIIVTKNVRHFPGKALEPFGTHAATPDSFLCDQFYLEPKVVLEAIERQAFDIGLSVETILGRLEGEAPNFVGLVKRSRE